MAELTRGQRVAAALGPITLGASLLGRDQASGAGLAEAMVSSRFGQIDTSNNYMQGLSGQLLGDALRHAPGVPSRGPRVQISVSAK